MKFKTMLPVLPLPGKLPDPRTIHARGKNETHYAPDMWELEYQALRYLKDATDRQILERYESIARNMEVIVEPGRDAIPIESFLSSWYWFRKEHQTRLELLLRHLSPPIDPLAIATGKWKVGVPFREPSPNSGRVLFRFMKQARAEALVATGVLRLGAAAGYAKGVKSDPRTDIEQIKDRFSASHLVRVTTADGKEMPVAGNLKRSVSLPAYYLCSFSCDYCSLVPRDFNYDACVYVRDGGAFTTLIERAAADQYSDLLVGHMPIEYYDPFESYPGLVVNPATHKDFSFAWQSEYRVILGPSTRHIERTDLFLDLQLGSIDRLAEVHRVS